MLTRQSNRYSSRGIVPHSVVGWNDIDGLMELVGCWVGLMEGLVVGDKDGDADGYGLEA